MTFFTIEEFTNKYNQCQNAQQWQIEMACEMTYSEIGLRYRDPSWNTDSVPTPIKNASMEQLRFMLEYEIPTIDYKGMVEAGDMRSELSSNYSTLARTILRNNGYLNRGVPINYNMGMRFPF